MGENRFVAIRMIVLKEGREPEEFESFMIGPGGLLTEMWSFFNGKGLEELTFLRGNKHKDNFPSGPPYPRMSKDHAGASRADSTAAGANADYAWISCWTSKQINENIWKDASPGGRPPLWDGSTGLWTRFRDYWCHRGSRPLHGPPYDSVGASGLHVDRDPPPPPPYIAHLGRGAGCLVEGFEVVKEWP